MKALDRRDAAKWMEDDQADAFRAGKGAHGGGARIAGRGSHEGQGLVALFQRRVGQRRHHLHGHVLERQGRAVPQLQHPQIVVELRQRRLAVAQEGRTRALGCGLDRVGAQDIDAEQGQQFFRQSTVVGGGQVEIRCGIGFGHVEAAVGRQSVEQGAGKGAAVAETTGADVVHSVTISAENVRPCEGPGLVLQARP